MKDSQSDGHTFIFNCKEMYALGNKKGSLEVALCILVNLGCILSTLGEIWKHLKRTFVEH